MPQTTDEMETVFYQNAASRGEWKLFTDDPVWQRRLERLGIQPHTTVVNTRAETTSMYYTLTKDQVVIRKGKRAMSEAQRQAAAERLQKARG